ncbi:kinesin-like protein KIFC3 isoform X6 [Dicentrarchus labrax]|uniref:kinesin-like protein KIFC3 isoform X6 n=1 Tax=Dicentrarchus labrax TaxID=13489 RepID=UPI0021F6427F|nr:kinesin-like protein KIFC3 isoform X6 [Dicentrarchus labrax]
MYVLCTLAVLTLHSLIKSWNNKAVEPGGSSEATGRKGRPGDGGRGVPEVCGASRPRVGEHGGPRSCRAEGKKRRGGGGVRNVPDSRKRVQPVQRSSALLSPAVMFSTRKTWDLSHAPCLQELWKKDVSLDASSVDFLMSDGEDDGSFLSLPTAAFSQRPSLTAELTETNAPSQQLLIQTLQDKVCEFQARLRSEEVTRHLLLQQLQQHSVQEKTSVGGSIQTSAAPNGVRVLQPGEPSDRLSCPEEEQLVTRLRTQVEELEEKLLDQTQEVERLRSELGATDLEKQLELLVVENQRLKQELKSCRSSELQSLDAAAETCSCSHCPHSQDAESLRREVSRWESQARQRERRLAELERELLEKSSRAESLRRQLDESTRQLDDGRRQLEEARRRQKEAEQKLSLRLQECEEELARQAATPPRVKYVTHTVEVESADSQKALAELQTKNAGLQEQLSVQRQLLRELETQLHESQRTCAQLRTQLLTDRGRLCGFLSKAVGRGNGEMVRRLSKILVYEGEMERAQGQLEAEMQNLEEEKNRVIEEAFIRAESEMKAVHENLAGVRMNLLSLQPALRTLTCDYNCLKRQVQDFPFMLDKAITEAKQEICQVISEVSSTNQELLRKYKREMNLRKKCHNELVRLKGNIRVFCRVRPVSQEEQDSADARTMLSFDSEDDAVLYLSNKGKIMTFELDKVFAPQATQEEVFQEVQSLVTSCIDGFNVCIFAYGQTGSGKTYTMEGVVDDPGINQRALRLLFSEVTEKAPDWDYKITVSMVEIYNETLRNLLGENPTDKLDIKMNPDGSGQLYVPGLTEFTVQSPEDINRVFELGHMNRATACTNLNEHSSRSHALLIITVSGFNSATGNRTQGKLNLVDLAGSERIAKSGAEGSRLREAQCINKSLSALGDVINALRSKHSHIPFRNSRLTYLLQDSLNGDSKTLMMVQVSPLPTNISESVCSLKFAQRVRSVELSSSSSRRHENSSTSSSPTHDSVELDSPPVTPVPLPISRASSAGSTLSSASRTPSSSRRRSQSQLSTGTDTHTCTHTYRYRHTHLYTHLQVQTHTPVYTPTGTDTHTCIHTHRYRHTHLYTHRYMCLLLSWIQCNVGLESITLIIDCFTASALLFLINT